MLYSEFVAGTGCKETDHNYQVYKNLEVMYMHSDMTKDEIYEYGKRLVDNSKTEAELKFEAEIKEQIETLKRIIELDKKDIEWQLQQIEWATSDAEIRNRKDQIKYTKAKIKANRQKIRTLKEWF